jgi:glycosyltransferase involved in cell wall biosynthesis
VEQLAKELSGLSANAELREKLGKNARMLVEQKFNWDKITAEYIKLYASLVEK